MLNASGKLGVSRLVAWLAVVSHRHIERSPWISKRVSTD